MRSNLGTFSVIDGLVSVDILSEYLDFLILDCEHGLESYSEQRARARTCAKRCEIYVRCPSLSRIDVQRCLELDVDGIMIPQIASFEQAERAVDYTFYPPLGTRGISPYTRPFGYSHERLEEKKRSINARVKLSLLVEGESGLADLDKITQSLRSSIHMIYFGLFDFANSLQLPADLANDRILSGVRSVVEMCHARDIKVGTIASSITNKDILEDLGVDYIVCKNDTELFIDGITQFVNS